MGRLLTATQRERYAREGFVFPISVLSVDAVRRFRAASDELEDRLGGRPRTIDVRQMHLHFGWAFELARCPQVLDAVEDVLGPNLLVWATELFSKHPDEQTVSIGWHRDEPYMGLEPQWTTTAWIALGDSTVANGCMRVVRSSAAAAGHGRGSGNGKTAEQPAPGDEILEVVLEPGQMSLHNARVLHGSGPNMSGEKRVGFVIRYVAPQARTLDGRPKAVLVRGRDDYGHFELIDPPDSDDPDAVDGLRQSAMRHLDAVLRNLERCR